MLLNMSLYLSVQASQFRRKGTHLPEIQPGRNYRHRHYPDKYKSQRRGERKKHHAGGDELNQSHQTRRKSDTEEFAYHPDILLQTVDHVGTVVFIPAIPFTFQGLVEGSGTDVEFSFDWTGEDPVKWKERGIVIRFPGNPCNGGYLVSTQAESKFPYSYKADPRQSYSKEFYDSATKESRKFGMLDGSKDFVFRFRSVTNEIGELTTCHYGRFRRIDYGHERKAIPYRRFPL